jgi:hypothetical protein
MITIETLPSGKKIPVHWEINMSEGYAKGYGEGGQLFSATVIRDENTIDVENVKFIK